MNQTLHIIKRLALGAISAISTVLALGKVLVSSLGDIQAVSASAGTFACVVLFLNSLPMWFVVSSFLLSTGYLVWSSIQDDRARWKAMRDYKATNDRAWAFQPQFLAQCEELETQHQLVVAQNSRIEEELDGMRTDLASIKNDLFEKILGEIQEAAMQRATGIALQTKNGLDQDVQAAFEPMRSALTERMRIIDKHHTEFMRRFNLFEEQMRQLPQDTGSKKQR